MDSNLIIYLVLRSVTQYGWGFMIEENNILQTSKLALNIIVDETFRLTLKWMEGTMSFNTNTVVVH